MIGLCPLASGSKGNAIYIGTPCSKILIDVGISVKDLMHRLSSIDVDIEQLDAVLLTHEHIDHIRGLSALVRKKNIPVFANIETAKAVAALVKAPLKFKIFSTGDPFTIGDIGIHPFTVSHDAMDPVAFALQIDGIKIGICADLGFVSSSVLHMLQYCHYLYIEANHKPSMVHACARPLIYKQRVLSRLGHLSNEEAADVIDAVYHDRLRHIYLAHLSSECNHPDVALHTVRERLQKHNKIVSVSIAPQDCVAQTVLFS